MKTRIHSKTMKALKGQIEHATKGGQTRETYTGLIAALLAILQAHGYSVKEADKILTKYSICVSRLDLEKYLTDYKGGFNET